MSDPPQWGGHNSMYDAYVAVTERQAKIQNGRHFWGGENILKIAKIALLRYPVRLKFCRNRSISHG